MSTNINDITPRNTYAGNAEFSERMEKLKALAGNAGLRLPRTILPEGTALIQYGEERKRQLEAEISALPDALDAVKALQGQIAREDPQDREVTASLIRMDERGGLKNAHMNGAGLPYNATGFQHVAQFIKPGTIRNGFAENILALPVGLRAQVFNHWANTTRRPQDITMRTIREVNSGARFIRAVTSNKHSLTTGDDSAIAEALLNDPETFLGAKARITRDEDRSEFELIWPMLARQVNVGDIVKGGVRIVNSETKAGALRVEAFVLRVLCLNFTTAESSDKDDESITIRHVGDLRTKLPRALAAALLRIDPLVKAFGDAYQKPMVKDTRAEALEFVAKKYALPERVLTNAAALWDSDGEKSAGNTLAGLVNALTRASQLEAVSVAGEVERVAGRLVVGR
jgi:hypothetical protein